MPYVSPAPAWMPGKEALEHIKRADRCSDSEAVAQLRAAVLDHAVPIRFQGRSTPRLPKRHPLGFFLPQGGPGGSPILSVNWRDLLLPTAQFRMDGMVKFSKTRWQPFEVRRNEVLRYWPDRRASTSAEERRCLKWLIADLKARGIANVTKKERREHAIKEFGVSRRGFDRIWPEAAREAGFEEKASRPGRKKRIGSVIVTPNKS